MIDIPIRVKDALKSGMYKKNYRVIVYGKNGNVLKVLDNNQLITESVKIDERMCSGKVIKFGLCEGSSLEFQYFDYENINGKRVKLMLDIEYLDSDNVKKWYELPMGYYNVDSCSRQFSTGIYKASCYNKLKSEYMDKDATELIKDVVAKGDAGSTGSATVGSILDSVLDGFSIEPKYEDAELDIRSYNVEPRSDITNMHVYGQPNNASLFVPMLNVRFYDYPYSKAPDAQSYYRFVIPVRKIKQYVNKIASEFASTTVESRPTGKYFGSADYLVKAQEPAQSIYAEPWIRIINAQGITLVNENINLLEEDLQGNYVTPYYTGLNKNSLSMRLPLYMFWRASSIYNATNWAAFESLLTQEQQEEILQDFRQSIADFNIERKITTDADNIKIDTKTAEGIQNVTLRDLQSAVFEMNCQFGRLDRDTDLFSGLSLNNNRLLPSDALYPSDNLFPQSNAERTDASAYEKLWTDSVGVQKFRDLIITYKGIVDGQEKDLVLQRTVNADGTTDYNMSSNWLFKNLVWTEEQVAEYADAMVELMRNVSWFPFEMWATGLPYLETGDELEITNAEGTYTSYILQRQLNGIQMLKDTFINGELDIF